MTITQKIVAELGKYGFNPTVNDNGTVQVTNKSSLMIEDIRDSHRYLDEDEFKNPIMLTLETEVKKDHWAYFGAECNTKNYKAAVKQIVNEITNYQNSL